MKINTELLLDNIQELFLKEKKIYTTLELYDHFKDKYFLDIKKSNALSDLYTALIFDNRFFLKDSSWNLRDLTSNKDIKYQQFVNKTISSLEIDHITATVSEENIEALKDTLKNGDKSKWKNQKLEHDLELSKDKKEGNTFLRSGKIKEINWLKLKEEDKKIKKENKKKQDK